MNKYPVINRVFPFSFFDILKISRSLSATDFEISYILFVEIVLKIQNSYGDSKKSQV